MSDKLPADAVTPNRAAREVDVHVSSLYRLMHSGVIRYWRKGKCRFLVSLAEVTAYFAPRPVVAPATMTATRGRTQAEGESAAEAAKARLREMGWKV